jgi:hypothetical protein
MGTNGGSGLGSGPGANELGGMMGGNPGSSHPPATEYTLQGKRTFPENPLMPHSRLKLGVLIRASHKASCAFYRQNGTDTSGIGTRGKSKSKR